MSQYVIMTFNNIIWPSVGADYAVSKNKTDDEIGPSTVTLSHTCSERSEEAAKGLSRGAERCFAELTLSGANVRSMTVL